MIDTGVEERIVEEEVFIAEEKVEETVVKPIKKKNFQSVLADRHKDICKKIHQVYLVKSADYGDSFHQTYKKFGITSAAIRISDKYNRMMKLMEGHSPKVKDESLYDTMLDLCGYLILTMMELDNEKHRNEGSKD